MSTTQIGETEKYSIDNRLYTFINAEVLPQTPLSESDFWSGFANVLDQFLNDAEDLIQVRKDLQEKIDTWHKEQREQGKTFDKQTYKTFLEETGYLVPAPESVCISVKNVDEEIAKIAGPQLVVPIQSARIAVKAANARWNSLYDALYGSDVIDQSGDRAPVTSYNPKRGESVIAYAKEFLDECFPLKKGSHKDATSYSLYYQNLIISLNDGSSTGLAKPGQMVAVNGAKADPESILLRNNGLHVEIEFDRHGSVGKDDPASIQDIHLESAVTTIMDCEDSVAAVDAEDKMEVYKNWLGLTMGTLQTEFEKEGEEVRRRLSYDRIYTSTETGDDYKVHGRALMMIRNVGAMVRTELVTNNNGDRVNEGIVDALVTALIASIDVRKPSEKSNSREGSIYLVKPKVHGPQEVALNNRLYGAIEDLLKLDRNTIKMGMMDEERRTSLNLAACIAEASERIIFINTGFLDRSGDEIRTSMEAGVFLPKAELESATWIEAYEKSNVEVGLACGFSGSAQIGKGMWAMPGQMKRMLIEKAAHPESGATTAWVPSPTAATLFAMHYHKVDVFARHAELHVELTASQSDTLDKMLEIPLAGELTSHEIEAEIDNNVQAILGYCAHWVDQGVGCSVVLDIHNIGMMEDRATLRVSSQLLANWLHHNVCTEEQVLDSLSRMTKLVDQQNAGDSRYRPMAPNPESSYAFLAAKDLIFKGREQPNGYVEPLLHDYRRKVKASSYN